MKKANPLKWIFKNTKKYFFSLLLITLLSGFFSLGFIALAVISKNIINIATGTATGNITAWIIALAVVVILQVVSNLLTNHLRVVVTGKLDQHFKQLLFEDMLLKRYSELSKYHTGEIVNRFSSDVDTVINGVVHIIPNIFSIAVKIVSGIAVLMAFNTTIALITIVIGIIIILFTCGMSPVFKKYHKSFQKAQGEVKSIIQESAENITVIKTFTTKKALTERLVKKMQEWYKIRIKRNHLGNFSGGFLFLLFTGGYYAILCWGAFGISNSTLDYGTLMAFLQIVSQIRAPLNNTSSLLVQSYSCIASAERLIEFQNMETEPISENFNAKAVYNSLKAIKAENLEFSYNNEKYVIKKSDFSISKGSIVSVTGLSGGGKTTLFRLLLGLFETTNGNLYFECDDNDIEINSSCRGMFSYVPQGNMILSGTIKDNLTLGKPDVSEENLVNATKTACIYDMIEKLPDGFDTVLGERGLGLSEGQIQRLAIARAIIADAPIILLDECTSALDIETETKILDNIKNLKSKTVLFISHRANTLKICDSVLHMDGGVFTLERL